MTFVYMHTDLFYLSEAVVSYTLIQGRHPEKNCMLSLNQGLLCS